MANQGKGFGRTVDASELRKYSSWGRTRQPKNIAGPHGTTITPLAHDTIVSELTSESGYATENQRYLHLAATIADNHTYNVEIWFYSYALGDAWFQLEATADQTFATPNGAAKLYKKLEISGLDRVIFIKSAQLNGGNTDVSLTAACSTF